MELSAQTCLVLPQLLRHQHLLTKSYEGYLSKSAIWKIKSDLSENRNLKCKSYDKSVAKLKATEPTPDRDIVWKKVPALPINCSRKVKNIMCKDD
jgi:hypothetical protein